MFRLHPGSPDPRPNSLQYVSQELNGPFNFSYLGKAGEISQ